MSLDGPRCAIEGIRPRLDVEIPEVDDYTEGAWCSRCNRELHHVTTPQVPVVLLVDDELALTFQDAGVDEIPAFGWRCDRHRTEVVLPAPYMIAPDPYRPVDARLGDDEITLAVPEPILDEVDA